MHSACFMLILVLVQHRGDVLVRERVRALPRAPLRAVVLKRNGFARCRRCSRRRRRRSGQAARRIRRRRGRAQWSLAASQRSRTRQRTIRQPSSSCSWHSWQLAVSDERCCCSRRNRFTALAAPEQRVAGRASRARTSRSRWQLPLAGRIGAELTVRLGHALAARSANARVSCAAEQVGARRAAAIAG